MTSNGVIEAMEAGELENYIYEIKHGELSVAVLGDFKTGHSPGSTTDLMGLQSVNRQQARRASCCWSLHTRDKDNPYMNSDDGTSTFDQIWIFDGKGH